MKFKITETEKRALCRQVPEFREFVRQITLPELECDGDLFGGLVRSIVSQQLAIRAAEAILGRLEALTGELSAERILAADHGALRACGLSSRKVEYLRGIADAAVSGSVDFASLAALDDAAVIQKLIQLKGVGVWTAEMLLIFGLRRPDVVSWGDLAILRGMRMLYRKRSIDQRTFQRLRKRYSPYGTTASLYLWAIACGALPELTDPGAGRKPDKKRGRHT